MENNSIKRILIFKLCCFGDIVFLTPTISSLRNNFPNAEITLISSSWIKNLYTYIEDVDKLLLYEPPSKRDNIFIKISKALKLILLLRKNNFDLVFMGHRNSFFGLIVFLAGIKYRFGFSNTKFLNITAKFEDSINENLRYLKVLKENGFEIGSAVSKLKIPDNVYDLRRKYDITDNKKIVGVFPFGGLNPGTKMGIKKWNINKYVELSKRLSEYSDKIVILFFQGREGEEFYDIEKHNIKNLFSLSTGFEISAVCNVFVAGDTGLLHIAAAMGVETIGLFGPSDPRLLAPLNDYGNKNIYIWKGIECSPCYTPKTAIETKNKKYWNGNNFICHTGTHNCINEITVEDVYNAILNKLKLL